jgi:hypothetical protein
VAKRPAGGTEGLSAELQHHQAMGLLLALYQAGMPGRCSTSGARI